MDIDEDIFIAVRVRQVSLYFVIRVLFVMCVSCVGAKCS